MEMPWVESVALLGMSSLDLNSSPCSILVFSAWHLWSGFLRVLPESSVLFTKFWATCFLASMAGLSRRLGSFPEFCFHGTSRSDGQLGAQEFALPPPISVFLLYLGAPVLGTYVCDCCNPLMSWPLYYHIVTIFVTCYRYLLKVYLVCYKYKYPCSLLVSIFVEYLFLFLHF